MALNTTTSNISAVPNYTVELGYEGNKLIYQGKAKIGSLTSQAVWQIKKLIYSGDNLTAIQWANGNDSFNNIWDNRNLITYS